MTWCMQKFQIHICNKNFMTLSRDTGCIAHVVSKTLIVSAWRMGNAKRISPNLCNNKLASVSMDIHCTDDVANTGHNSVITLSMTGGLYHKSLSPFEVQLPYECGGVHFCQKCEIHYKCIHKGNDAVHIEIRQNCLNHDDILQHLNARNVGLHQAVYRIMQYKMHEKNHIII